MGNPESAPVESQKSFGGRFLLRGSPTPTMVRPLRFHARVSRRQFYNHVSALFALFFLTEWSLWSHYMDVVWTDKQRQEAPPAHAVFYHIFFPSSDNVQHAIDIVNEQLGQVARLSPDSAVFATAIGPPRHVPAVDGLCRQHQLDCQTTSHETGFEEVTLSRLQDFCQQYPASTVTYLHSKGTYHEMTVNEYWRPILTAAALSRDCQDGIRDNSCNVCGLQFFTQWNTFFPGNMWTARCDYVQKLLPVDDMAAHYEQVFREVLLMRLRGQLSTDFLKFDRPDFFGLDRYAGEQWIGSHPQLRPCDCDATGDLDRYINQPSSLDDLSWAVGPRHEGFASGKWDINPRVMQKAKNDRSLRDRQFYLLPGHLLRWLHFYQEVPPADSWVWQWFPDGPTWQEHVRQHGSQVVDVVTRSHRTKHVPVSFHTLERLSKTWNNSSHAVFYDVLIVDGVDDDGFQDSMHLVRKQLDELRNTTLPNDRQLFIVTMGDERLKQTNLCSDTTNCVRDQHLDRRYEGESLRRLHAFCADNPSSRVTYLQNLTPWELLDEDEARIRSLLLLATKGALSQPCQRALDTRQVNVCGLRFQTTPALAMTGNMWSAECSYVSQLLTPVDFETKQRGVILDALVKMVKGELSMGLIKDREDYLGLDGHSMSLWIASNPALQPGSLLDDDVDELMEKGADLTVKEARIPREMTAIYDIDNTKLNKLLADKKTRIPEYQFLAGHLTNWETLYGHSPDELSWIWLVFPDGQRWRAAVREFGALMAVQRLLTVAAETKGT